MTTFAVAVVVAFAGWYCGYEIGYTNGQISVVETMDHECDERKVGR